MVKVLFLEDDVNLGYMVKNGLKATGRFEVIHLMDGSQGIKANEEFKPDVIVSDIEMPEVDGFSLVKDLRKNGCKTPIILATGRVDPSDVIKGMTTGIEYYAKKPYSVEELIAYIDFVLSQKSGGKNASAQEKYTVGNYTLDINNCRLMHPDMDHELTEREAGILQMLCMNMNEVVERGAILLRFWGEIGYYPSRSLDVFVNKFRNYMKDGSVELRTVRGIGLKLITKQTNS